MAKRQKKAGGISSMKPTIEQLATPEPVSATKPAKAKKVEQYKKYAEEKLAPILRNDTTLTDKEKGKITRHLYFLFH